MEAYQITLDGLMQQAILDSAAVNDVQLIILAVEGAFVGLTSVVVMWVVTSQLALRRFAVFSIFMLVPSGIIKSQATKAVDLEQTEEDEGNEVRRPCCGFVARARLLRLMAPWLSLLLMWLSPCSHPRLAER